MNKDSLKDRVEDILSQLTLEEKIGMIHGNGLFRTEGVKRLNIPPIKMSDGPMGVRAEFKNDEWMNIGNSDDYVTYLPSNMAIASTWNREKAKESGEVLGEEARGRGKDMILAPGINIVRSPLCGRNFEYMSEDPCLISEMCVPLIEGIQESDVSACVKHFAVNTQETMRLEVESIVDDQALNEIYYPGFKAAVQKAHTHGVMGAYNLLKGENCCQSKYLLSDVLRDQWGFDGIAVSDWGGVHDTKKVAESGLDIEMSVTYNFDEYFMAQPLLEAVKKGEIKEEVIDEKVRHILATMYRLHMLDGGRKSGCYNTPEHRAKVLETASEAVVLLKNEEEILPLNSEKLDELLVIGDNAERIHSNGGGSAEIKALYEISPLMGLKSQLGGNTEVVYTRGYNALKKDMNKELNWQETSLEEGNADAKDRDKNDESVKVESKRLREEAVELAKKMKQVVLFIGLNHDYDVEGLDKKDMKLPYEQDELVKSVLAVNKNTIIVVMAGAPVEMGEWIDQAKAVVWSSYIGMEGGNAITNVLLGKVNPSGKLPVTFPKTYLDCPAHCVGDFGGEKVADHKEGIFVGYRYYDTFNVEPQFCFGYGLSYTTFAYENLELKKKKDVPTKVLVSFDIRNTGDRAGAEVAQIYVANPQCTQKRPKKELKGFEKVYLEPGQAKRVVIELEENAFSYYSMSESKFVTEESEFQIMVGSSSRDIQLEGMLQL
ncbi:beta-glucosidase [Lachnospiraceae bacterium KM106-2]|nr:beta-glucosidase [Lachnospiraceae bacterium KM106-2]